MALAEAVPGLYPIPLPSGIGLEACGEIEEVGPDVSLFKVGDRVTHASMPIEHVLHDHQL